MEEEKITINGKNKKPLSKLVKLIGGLGFNKIDLKKDQLIVEKNQGEDISGRTYLHYKVIFSKNKIEFIYSIVDRMTRRRRLVECYPVLLSILKIIEDYYELNSFDLLSPVVELLKEMEKTIDKDSIDISSELDEFKEKYSSMVKKYEDLVRSSEQNARVLLETERKLEEKTRRVEELEKMSDESLKEQLFTWIKIRGGSINMDEFCKINLIEKKRAEEGLNLLIKEGYIKKKSE